MGCRAKSKALWGALSEAYFRVDKTPDPRDEPIRSARPAPGRTDWKSVSGVIQKRGAAQLSIESCCIRDRRSTVYCIYTDTEVTDTSGNYDHIIPLSLGGSNDFCVWSELNFNSKIGSKVDGALPNDALIMLARRDADARGHSGNEVLPAWKKTTFEGRPVQVSWGEEVKVWDSRARACLDPNDFLNKPMESRWIYNPFARSKFTAKVALGGGYFLFGDSFLGATDCNELRRMLAADDLTKFRTTFVAHDPVLKGHWPTDIIAFRLMCEFKGRSTLIVIPMADGIAFHLGVLGMYVGSIFCAGNTSKLTPPEDQVVVLGPGPLERPSLKAFAQEFQSFLEEVKRTRSPQTDRPPA